MAACDLSCRQSKLNRPRPPATRVVTIQVCIAHGRLRAGLSHAGFHRPWPLAPWLFSIPSSIADGCCDVANSEWSSFSKRRNVRGLLVSVEPAIGHLNKTAGKYILGLALLFDCLALAWGGVGLGQILIWQRDGSCTVRVANALARIVLQPRGRGLHHNVSITLLTRGRCCPITIMARRNGAVRYVSLSVSGRSGCVNSFASVCILPIGPRAT